jgi:pimeloyl-ACP methyl ester carboxylesterase
MEKFTVISSDGITICGIKNNPPREEKRIVCLHMMPATKESYTAFMQEAQGYNWLVVAIDFRGHGESTQRGTLDYTRFTDEDHHRYKLDAYATAHTVGEGHAVDAIIGASIGANIALQLQVDMEVTKTVLLSPGINYKGVEALPAAGNITSGQAVYIITSEEVRQSGSPMADEAQTIFDACNTPHKQIDRYPGTEHGTDIVIENTIRTEKIVAFLK